MLRTVITSVRLGERVPRGNKSYCFSRGQKLCICYNLHLKNRNRKHRKRNSTSNISRLNFASCKTMKNYEGR